MQRRKKFYSAIYTSLALLSLLFFLQNKEFLAPLLTEENEAVSLPPDPPDMQIPTNEIVPIQNTPSWSTKTLKLISIFDHGNDNDPALDTEFRELSEDDKKELIKLYDSLPHEKRNQRGTIVFLLGRAVQNSHDLDFIFNVLKEPKCLSSKDCKVLNNEESAELTLIYPQIVALTVLRSIALNNSSLRAKAKTIALNFINDSDPRISDSARSIAESK